MYILLVNREIEFISFSIRDRSAHEDNQCVLDFSFDLCDRIKIRQVILVQRLYTFIFLWYTTKSNDDTF